MPYIQLAMERSKKDWIKAVGKQRFGRNTTPPYTYLKFPPMNYISISIFNFMFYSFITIPIWVCLTKIYKVTIACFRSTISVGSTLTHVRYYLDDPVHLLVSCAELQKCDCNFVHQVFGAVAGDCSSLDNWRFILLLRLGNFIVILSLLFLIFKKYKKKFLLFRSS